MLLKSRYDILMGRPGHEIPDPVPPKRGTVVSTIDWATGTVELLIMEDQVLEKPVV